MSPCSVCQSLSTYLPTLLDYLGVSQLEHKSPGLPYQLPNLQSACIITDKTFLFSSKKGICNSCNTLYNALNHTQGIILDLVDFCL